jgi:hypothetical protein
MKNWWLSVYTIPALKKYSLPLIAWGSANLLNALFISNIRELCFIVALYPLFVYFDFNENFSSNIDFHKSHVNFENIRKILFLDSIIQLVIFWASFLLLGYLPWIGKKSSTIIFDFLGTPATSFLWIFLFVFFLLFVKLGVLK